MRPLLHLLVLMLLIRLNRLDLGLGHGVDIGLIRVPRRVVVVIVLGDVKRLQRHRLVGQPLCFAGSAPGGHPTDHFAGTVIGAPFCFTKNTRNLAGFVVLAFRETVCTSSGDS